MKSGDTDMYIHLKQKSFFYVRARNSMKFLLMIQTGSFHVLSTVLKVKLSKQKNKTKKTNFIYQMYRSVDPFSIAKERDEIESPDFTFDFESDVCTFRNY